MIRVFPFLRLHPLRATEARRGCRLRGSAPHEFRVGRRVREVQLTAVLPEWPHARVSQHPRCDDSTRPGLNSTSRILRYRTAAKSAAAADKARGFGVWSLMAPRDRHL